MSLIFSPAIPFIGQFPSGFRNQTALTIQGNVPPKADKFTFNLMAGPYPLCSDIALCTDMLFNEQVLTRNTRQCLSWGIMESFPIPIVRGYPFEACFVCDKESILMTFNNEDLDEYPHRISPDCIDYLGISGDVDVVSISTKNAVLCASTAYVQ